MWLSRYDNDTRPAKSAYFPSKPIWATLISMRLRNVIAATLAFTYIFYSLSYRASAPEHRTRARVKKPMAPAVSEAPKRSPAAPRPQKTEEKVAQADRDEEDAIPWEELREDFVHTVEEHLVAVEPTKAKKIMATYLQERDSFTKKIESLMKERDTYYYYDKETEKVIFKDKLKYKELNKEVTSSFEEYNSKVEKIFADHYPAVMAVREQFEEYMQLYNRHEHRIGIGL